MSRAGFDPASRNSKHRNHLYEISFHKDKVSSSIKLANRPAGALDSGFRRNDKSLCDKIDFSSPEGEGFPPSPKETLTIPCF